MTIAPQKSGLLTHAATSAGYVINAIGNFVKRDPALTGIFLGLAAGFSIPQEYTTAVSVACIAIITTAALGFAIFGPKTAKNTVTAQQKPKNPNMRP